MNVLTLNLGFKSVSIYRLQSIPELFNKYSNICNGNLLNSLVTIYIIYKYLSLKMYNQVYVVDLFKCC